MLLQIVKDSAEVVRKPDFFMTLSFDFNFSPSSYTSLLPWTIRVIIIRTIETVFVHDLTPKFLVIITYFFIFLNMKKYHFYPDPSYGCYKL